MLNKNIQQQLKKSDLTEDNLPQSKEQWQYFLALINSSYTDNEHMLKLLEKSMEGSLDEHGQCKELQVKAQKCINVTRELQVRTTFMENMSHEIRTKIYGILGSLEIVKDSKNLNEKDYKFIDTALMSGENLLDIANNILDFTKIADKELELEETDFNIKELLADINSVVSSVTTERNLILITEVSEDLPERIKGDSVRVRQIIMNLVDNALKFTHKGKITLQAYCTKQLEEETILRFEITDTGIGIDDSIVEKIVASFVPSNDSIMNQVESIGLGLIITKELVNLMGGSINIESIKGEGTHIWVDIPFKSVDISDIKQESKSTDLSNLKVLVVEQLDMSHSVLEHYFSMWGVESEYVDNCQEAIEKLYQGRDELNGFDAMMIDYYMPGTECFELSEMLNRHQNFQNISKVTLTSYNLAEQEREIANIKICLVKPIREVQLKNVLLKCLKNKNGIKTENESLNDSLVELDILLVEDNYVNALLAMTMMEQIGFSVKHVENGQQAVNEVKKNNYKLVLMDVHMPIMDGYKATQNIREWEKSAGVAAIPIIALTADAQSSDKEKCLTSGMNGYLSKPIKQKILQQTVSKWVEKVAETSV